MAESVITNDNAAYAARETQRNAYSNVEHTTFAINQNNAYITVNRQEENEYSEVQKNPFKCSVNTAYDTNRTEGTGMYALPNLQENRDVTVTAGARRRQVAVYEMPDLKRNSEDKLTLKRPSKCDEKTDEKQMNCCCGVFLALVIGVFALMVAAAAISYSVIQILELQAQLNNDNKALQMLQVQLETSNQQIQILETKLNSSLKQTGIEVMGLPSQLEEFMTQLGMLQSQFDAFGSTEQPNNDLQDQVNTANQQLQTLQVFQTQQENISQALLSDIDTLQSNVQTLKLFYPGITMDNPASSCGDNGPSGMYWIQTSSTSSPVQVYCDMNRTSCSCSSTGGWLRIANLDMTDPNQNCPNELNFFGQGNPRTIRTCGRPGNTLGCVSTTYSTYGVEYSQVCGRIIAYQLDTTDGFQPYQSNNSLTIDSSYVDGVSLTYGQSPRQHIWTFASAFNEGAMDALICPCIRSNFTGTVPPFINQDYFCDTAGGEGINRFNSFDPLWDAMGCGGESTCCEFNNPPWFCRQLPQPTTEDIELRICGSETTGSEDTPLEQVELYVR